MRFLLNVLLIVALLVGVTYFFLRDTPFLSAVLPQQIGNVPASESVRKVFLRRVRIAIKEQASTDPSMLAGAYYPEALQNKFNSLAAGGGAISRAQYLSAKRQEHDVYVRGAYDKDGSGSVEKNEWPGSEVFSLSVLDQDKNNILTYEEMWTRGESDSLRVFTSADRNGDGALTQEEYWVASGGDGARDTLIREVDLNSNNAIDLDEWRKGNLEAERHWQP